MKCPDCGSGRRSDGYHREGWYWLECDRRYNPETDTYSPKNNWCKLCQLETKYEELHTACLEYLNHPPANVPARRKFAEIVTGGSTAPLQSMRDVHTVECTAGLLAGHDCICGYSRVKIGIDTEQHECKWHWFIDYVTPEAGFKCLHGHTIDLYQAQTRLNEHETLKGEVETLRGMLNELIDCHYGIKDSPSKEMAEKIEVHYWKADLARDRS